jgi:hypothetical protein
MSKLQEKPSALKREHPALQKIKFINFSLFVGHFALLDPDLDRESGSRCESGSRYGSGDPIESGSTTLTKGTGIYANFLLNSPPIHQPM